MAELGINWDEVPEERSYTPLPDGDYFVEVTDADREDRPDEGTSTVKIEYTIISENQFNGRTVRSNHSIYHPDSSRVEIGLATLQQLCKATKVLRPHDTSQFIGQQCYVRLVASTGKNGKTYSNVKAWWSTDSQPPPHKQATMTAPAARPTAPTPPPQQRPTAPPSGPQVWRPGQVQPPKGF
jgi:hypothetical protein